MRNPLCQIVAVCAFIPILFANAQQPETEPLKFEFRVMAIGNGNFKDIYYIEEPLEDEEDIPQLKEIQFSYMNRSARSFDYEGPSPIRFFRITGKNPEGLPILKQVGSARVPRGVENPLFFFTQAKKSATNELQPEFNIEYFNDDPNNFPEGSVAFVNATPIELYLRLADRNYLLNPGANGPYKISEFFNEPVFVGMVVRWEDGVKVVLKNEWEFIPGYRNIMLILPPKRAGSSKVRVYRITDYVGEDKRFNPNYAQSNPTP